jgi:hypothetical protein
LLRRRQSKQRLPVVRDLENYLFLHSTVASLPYHFFLYKVLVPFTYFV